MPTKLKRFTISFPPEIQKLIEDDSTLNGRTISNVVVWNLKKFYEEQKRQADLFKPQQLEEEQRQVPYFETPNQPDVVQPSKTRASKGRGQS